MATGTLDKGTKVRVNFTGIIGSKPQSGLKACTRVTENSAFRWEHYLYLQSREISESEDRSAGAVITVEFDAVVIGDYASDLNATTLVKELGGKSGFVHYLYLASEAVTVIEEEKPVALAAPPGIKEGDLIEADLNVQVPEGSSASRFFTTEVAELDGVRATHFLFLDSGNLTRVPDDSDRQRYTGKLTMRVTGTPGAGKAGTTEVREVSKDGFMDYTHFVYLGSESVTVIKEEKPEPAPEPAPGPSLISDRIQPGDRIQVDITGNFFSPADPGQLSTSGIREDSGSGAGFLHYLYLGSGQVQRLPGSSGSGPARYRARFTALVADTLRNGQNATTEVREILGDGSASGCTHYVYLKSPSVTRLAPGKPAAPEPVTRSVGGDRVFPGRASFESKDVLNRIAELESLRASAFTITRTRTGQVITTVTGSFFPTRSAVDEYLDSQDYNPARFTVEEVPVIRDADEEEELRLLRELNTGGLNLFGSAAWITDSVKLFSDGSVGEDWARDQAAARLNVSLYQLDEWPLIDINWSDAAEDLLAQEYFRIDFGTVRYWGKS